MTLSHWGIFPGYYKTKKADSWIPLSFEDWLKFATIDPVERDPREFYGTH